MSRREFTRETKREAWDRSGEICEATGDLYGWPEGHRCNMPLSKGVEYDHIDMDCNSKDNSLKNCAAVCPACHHYKTNHFDKPRAAKTLRQQDADRNIQKRNKRIFPGSRADVWKRPVGGGNAVRR